MGAGTRSRVWLGYLRGRGELGLLGLARRGGGEGDREEVVGVACPANRWGGE